jgi:hypothetical protein
MLFAGMCTGFGGGIALNKLAYDFNKIENREERIARLSSASEGKERYLTKLNEIRLNYLR